MQPVINYIRSAQTLGIHNESERKPKKLPRHLLPIDPKHGNSDVCATPPVDLEIFSYHALSGSISSRPTTYKTSEIKMKRIKNAKSAFTLIELLTVIAIIGILAAIIIPTVGKVRQTARGAQCKSNLRQIASAALLYSEDNKGKLPLCRDPDKTDELGYGGKWPVLLAKYLGRDATTAITSHKQLSVVICPANPNHWGYGYNYRSLSPWISGNNFDTVSLNVVSQPSRVIMFSDTNPDSTKADTEGAWDSFVRWPGNPADGKWDATPPDKGTISFRHGNTCNVAWVDGHVSAERPNTDFSTADKTDLSRSMWGVNNSGKSLWTGK